MAISVGPPPSGSKTAGFQYRPKKLGDMGIPLFADYSPKGSGKSSSWTTLAKATEKKHHILSFDSNTRNGVAKFLTDRLGTYEKAETWAEEHLVIEQMGDYYDPSDTSTAGPTLQLAASILGQWKDAGRDGKVAGVIVEHYEEAFDEMGPDAIRYEKGVPKNKRPDFRDYSIRSQYLDPIDSTFMTIPCDFRVLCGREEREENKMVGTGRFKKVDGQDVEITEVKKVTTPPKWIAARSLVNNVKVTFEKYRVPGQVRELGDGTKIAGKPAFYADVVISQHPRFTDGMSMNITGVGMAAYFGDWWSQQIGLAPAAPVAKVVA